MKNFVNHSWQSPPNRNQAIPFNPAISQNEYGFVNSTKMNQTSSNNLNQEYQNIMKILPSKTETERKILLFRLEQINQLQKETLIRKSNPINQPITFDKMHTDLMMLKQKESELNSKLQNLKGKEYNEVVEQLKKLNAQQQQIISKMKIGSQSKLIQSSQKNSGKPRFMKTFSSSHRVVSRSPGSITQVVPMNAQDNLQQLPMNLSNPLISGQVQYQTVKNQANYFSFAPGSSGIKVMNRTHPTNNIQFIPFKQSQNNPMRHYSSLRREPVPSPVIFNQKPLLKNKTGSLIITHNEPKIKPLMRSTNTNQLGNIQKLPQTTLNQINQKLNQIQIISQDEYKKIKRRDPSIKLINEHAYQQSKKEINRNYFVQIPSPEKSPIKTNQQKFDQFNSVDPQKMRSNQYNFYSQIKQEALQNTHEIRKVKTIVHDYQEVPKKDPNEPDEPLDYSKEQTDEEVLNEIQTKFQDILQQMTEEQQILYYEQLKKMTPEQQLLYMKYVLEQESLETDQQHEDNEEEEEESEDEEDRLSNGIEKIEEVDKLEEFEEMESTDRKDKVVDFSKNLIKNESVRDILLREQKKKLMKLTDEKSKLEKRQKEINSIFKKFKKDRKDFEQEKEQLRKEQLQLIADKEKIKQQQLSQQNLQELIEEERERVKKFGASEREELKKQLGIFKKELEVEKARSRQDLEQIDQEKKLNQKMKEQLQEVKAELDQNKADQEDFVEKQNEIVELKLQITNQKQLMNDQIKALNQKTLEMNAYFKTEIEKRKKAQDDFN